MSSALAGGVVLFAVYSWFGWGLEATYRSLTQRRWVNPGFLYGPFVPLYGVGAVVVLVLLHAVSGWPAVGQVALLGLALSALEYVVGALSERFLQLRLWDYSDQRFNLNGRICLSFSIVWAGLAWGFGLWLHPVVAVWVAALDPAVVQGLAVAFAIYFVVDLVTAIASLRAFVSLRVRLRSAFLRDSYGDLPRALARVQRLLDAFPYLNTQLFQGLERGVREAMEGHLQEGYRRLRREVARRRPVDSEYLALVSDILSHAEFLRLKSFFHHSSSIYEHAQNVSYLSYRLCKQLGLDYRSAARGGLLHDFFLYDWRTHDVPDLPRAKFHGIEHPRIALANAEENFVLNVVERDCIAKHMWPLTLMPPKYLESFVVSMVDKYLASREFLHGQPSSPAQRIRSAPLWHRRRALRQTPQRRHRPDF